MSNKRSKMKKVLSIICLILIFSISLYYKDNINNTKTSIKDIYSNKYNINKIKKIYIKKIESEYKDYLDDKDPYKIDKIEILDKTYKTNFKAKIVYTLKPKENVIININGIQDNEYIKNIETIVDFKIINNNYIILNETIKENNY